MYVELYRVPPTSTDQHPPPPPTTTTTHYQPLPPTINSSNGALPPFTPHQLTRPFPRPPITPSSPTANAQIAHRLNVSSPYHPPPIQDLRVEPLCSTLAFYEGPRILKSTAMVRIIPSRLKSYTGGGGSGTSTPNTNSNNSSVANSSCAPAASQKSNMHGKRDASPAGGPANGLMLRIVVLRVCPSCRGLAFLGLREPRN